MVNHRSLRLNYSKQILPNYCLKCKSVKPIQKHNSIVKTARLWYVINKAFHEKWVRLGNPLLPNGCPQKGKSPILPRQKKWKEFREFCRWLQANNDKNEAPIAQESLLHKSRFGILADKPDRFQSYRTHNWIIHSHCYFFTNIAIYGKTSAICCAGGETGKSVGFEAVFIRRHNIFKFFSAQKSKNSVLM